MGGRGQRKDKTTQKFMQALLGVTLAAHANPPPAVPEECKRAKELYSQFINKGKRAKAWKELESLLKAKPCSALCITAAKMHMIAAVEQVCKVEGDVARETVALESMHRVLECACQGAMQYSSIQCLVLAVFTLHTCRGRGTAEQLQWRRQQAQELEGRFGGPAGQAAKWGKTKWVDPRIESYEKDRFPFEWEPYSSKNLREWIEAVRDDWNKFMPTIARADQLAKEQGTSLVLQQNRAAEGLGRVEEFSPEAVREEIGTPVDVRLAGSFALKHCDKDTIRRHLEAVEAKRNPLNAALAAPPPPAPKPVATPASTRAGRAATAAAAAAVVQLAAAAGKEERAGGGGGGVGGAPLLPPPAPPPYSRGPLPDNPLLLPHQNVGKGRERHRAEQKRQQAQRAQQRAVEIQQYLSQQLESAGEDQEAAQKLLADSCCMGVEEFGAAAKAAVAAKELTQAEAELAMANLARLRGAEGVQPRHVWYGDPHLDVPDRRHEVEGQQEMEELLTEQLQQDWMVADEATEWVGSHLEGWRELLTRMGLEANTMTDVDRDSMLAQEDPSQGHTLVRVWTEDYTVPPPSDAGAEMDEEADAELEVLLPAGARPCNCGRCQREQQQQQLQQLPGVPSSGRGEAGSGKAAELGPNSGSSSRADGMANGVQSEDGCSRNGSAGVAGAAEPSTPTSDRAGPGPKRSGAEQPATAPCRADAAPGAGSSPSRVQLAQQQWREAMHSEEYGSVLQLDVYINEAERSQQYLDSILGRPEGLMQQCRVLAANPEGAPSNEADELVRRAVVGHLMLRLAGAWDEAQPPPQQQQEQDAAGPAAAENGATQQPAGPRGLRGGVTDTLHLLRRAMDPSCDLESLIMDCAVDGVAGRSAVQKLGQLREAELAAEAAASRAWAELAAAMQQEGVGNGAARSAGAPPPCHTVQAAGIIAAADMAAAGAPMDAREDDGAISRPVTFCTPLLITVLEGVTGVASRESGEMQVAWEQERERLRQVKGQLARSALLGLGQIWRRRRLTDKMSFQLCQFIADSLATCGELSSCPGERDVLRRAAERLLVGPAPAPCVLRLAGWLPLRVLRHLYTFVVLLVGECFASPQDLSQQIEDLVYADASAGALSEDGRIISVRPAVFAALTPVQSPGVQGPFMDILASEPLGRKRTGRADPFGPLASCNNGDMGALADSLRCSGPGSEGEGMGHGNWLARVAAYVCAPSEAQQAQQAQQEGGREEVVGDLHKLWHVEGVLLGLANLCEYYERGLDDSLARMEALRATLEQVVSGAKDVAEGSDSSKGPFMLEQQLLEARKVLQATEAVELSLRLAVIKMHGVCFEDVLHMLRERSVELDVKDEACTAAAIAKFECMLKDSSAEGEHCKKRMEELAVAPAPQLEGKEQETVRALGLLLGGGPNSHNGQRPPQQKIRALLAARPERWEASLTAGRELVLATLRRLDECTEALATLGEWCYIKQCSLIGQLRSQYCTHSCGDEIVGVLLRLLAIQCWEPAILAEQERERSALAQALETELEVEREREAQSKAAKKAHKAKQKAALQAGSDVQEPNGSQLGTASGPSAPSSNGSSYEDEAEHVEAAVLSTVPAASAAAAAADRPEEGTSGEGDWVAEMVSRQQQRPALHVPAAAAAVAAAQQVAQQSKLQPKLAKPQPKQPPKQPQPPALREVMRVVSYLGDWMCTCGQVSKLWDECICGQKPPCRDWVRGVCSMESQGKQCRFPHPPFDLPATTHIKKSDRIANPAADAPLYAKPPAAAAAASSTASKQAQQAKWTGNGTPSSHLTVAAAVPRANTAAAPLLARSLGSTASSSSSSLTGAGCLAMHPDLGLSVTGAWGLPVPVVVQQQQQPPPLLHQPAEAASGSAPAPPTFAAAVAGTAAATPAAGIDASDRSKPWPLQSGHSAPRAGSTGSITPSGRVSAAATAARAAPAAAAVGGGAGAPEAALPPGCPMPGLAAQGALAPAPFVAEPPAPAMQPAAPLLPVGPSVAGVPSAWGSSQGLDMEEGPGADEEAYFNCFNSQLLQGLGIEGPAGFAPMAVAEPPRCPMAPSHSAGAGEHNGFLGAIVLCLWYCTDFQQQVLSWQAPVYMGHPVVKALYSLFHALAEAEAHGRQVPGGLPSGGVGPLSSLCAGELKEALSALPGQLLATGAGEPCCAGDVLLAVYERIHEVAAMRGIPSASYSVFGIPVTEFVRCRSCRHVTHHTEHLQYVFYTQAATLRQQRRSLGSKAVSLGHMLRLIANQSQKSCDQGAGGCGVLNSVSQVIQRAPQVFTLQLGWGRQREEAQDIAATLREVQEQVDLADVYLDLPRQFTCRLRSMVCSSGTRYQAFAVLPELGGWVMYDDTTVTALGAWGDVLAKCEQGRIQPSLLFYVA